MNKPQRLKDLIPFLQANPAVTIRHWNGTVTLEMFSRFEAGLLWHVNEAGEEHHLPIACGMAAAAPFETGLDFDDDGFSMTKFGHTLRFDYGHAEPSQP
jgi:hypothetical protein